MFTLLTLGAVFVAIIVTVALLGLLVKLVLLPIKLAFGLFKLAILGALGLTLLLLGLPLLAILALPLLVLGALAWGMARLVFA
jgi:hypothetical protein